MYVEWSLSLTGKNKIQVENRLMRIEQNEHFGTVRNLKDGLWELKFNNGIRIYFAYVGAKEIILILGGNKNGQSKDIAKAKSVLNRRYGDGGS